MNWQPPRRETANHVPRHGGKGSADLTGIFASVRARDRGKSPGRPSVRIEDLRNAGASSREAAVHTWR